MERIDVHNKVFYAKFDGMYLGGHAVVVAKDERTAKLFVRRNARKHGLILSVKNIDLYEVNTENHGVPHLWNGDY